MSRTANFLDKYQNRKLKHMILPGSHDAGIYGDVYDGSFKSWTVTQSAGVGQQAVWGSRFFDIRVKKHEGELKTYHDPGKLLPGGGVGQKFYVALEELVFFVTSHPSEFVIARIAHLGNSADAIVNEIKEAWVNSPFYSHLFFKGTGNLADCTVGELRGKVIILIEKKGFDLTRGQVDGFHKLVQHKDKGDKAVPSVTDGLCICGQYSKSSKLEEIVKGQIQNYTAHDRHVKCSNSHLYALYWTATFYNIESNTNSPSNVGANFDRVKKIFKERTDNVQDLPLDPKILAVQNMEEMNRLRLENALNSCSMPNVILYDFVNEDKSLQIIQLNDWFQIK